MRSVDIAQAQKELHELIGTIDFEGEIVLTRDDSAVASLVPPKRSLRDLQPISLGRVLRPLSAEDDLLAEMRGE